MKIANIMFGRGLGGIEQAFLDYNEALLLAGHEVLAVSHPLAAINPEISGNLTHETISNRGSWDILSAARLRKLYRQWQPDFLISHGNRAISLNLLANHQSIHLGVTHNYHLRRFSRLDGVIAITNNLRDAAINAGVHDNRIHLLPNMVRLPEHAPSQAIHTPPVIGAMGRLIEKKGFHLLLRAASLLMQRDIEFKLIIGGTGSLESQLKQQAQQLGLQSHVTFLGWVGDKRDFFDQIDLFCLPSLHEPFGIVLLEAMAHNRPVVGFSSEGPREIIQNNEAMLVENGNVEALAEALAAQLAHPENLAMMGTAGREFVAENYVLHKVSIQLNSILKTLKPLPAKIG
jgi:glycosyltransferase involved in cell wall biosynthesis